jgi:hypothetical protein
MMPRHIYAAFAAAALPLVRLSAANADEPSVIEVPAAPERGFQHPYVLFLPKRVEGGPPQYLLVEPNNTGRPDDDFEVHRTAAIRLARDSSVGNFVAVRLGIPLLVPVFPRPSSIEDVYTHSLDRDTILIREGALIRIDKQLIAMAEDARGRLAALGRPVNAKLLLNGFSASGLFSNRFTFLHPDIVAAAAFGGLNGFIMVPASDIGGHALKFPLGLADFEEVAGYPFDREAYSRVPQFAYMGEKDQNDAVLHDDTYSAEERTLVFELFGRTMMPDRWNAVQAVYRQQKLPIAFKTYPGIPHGTNGAMNSEIAEFFRRVIQPPKT